MNTMNNEKRLDDQDSPAGSPGVEQTTVTHYAYDPQTYEILCRPGQRLSQKKAQRLQELKLYAHVVKSAT